MRWISLSESMIVMYRNYGVWAVDFFIIFILITKHNYYIHYLLQVLLQYSTNRKTLTLLTIWVTLSIQ